jgi:lysophospholipase L1-like esterase
MPKELHIVALGSSFAAGAGIEPLSNDDANRSEYNYTHQFVAIINAKSKEKARLTDRTVSGATTLNVLNEHQQTEHHRFSPQLDNFPRNADCVTFTCGGNDIGYIGSLSVDSAFAAASRNNGYVSDIKKPSAPAIPYDKLTDRIKEVIDEVHRAAPKARVYLVQYLSLIGTDTHYDENLIPLSEEKMKHYRGVAENLAQAYCEAAKGRNRVEVVPIAELSQKHALGSNEPWVNGFKDNNAPYHPNKEGHRNVAHILYERVFDGGGFLQD